MDDDLDAWVAGALRDARVARLGTADPDGAVRLVPVCFAVVDEWVVSVVDHKPKRTGQLRRLDDMRATGRATVLVDHYDDDWSQLWWVRVRGRAEVDVDGPARARHWMPSRRSTSSTATTHRPAACGASPWTRSGGGVRERQAGLDLAVVHLARGHEPALEVERRRTARPGHPADEQ